MTDETQPPKDRRLLKGILIGIIIMLTLIGAGAGVYKINQNNKGELLNLTKGNFTLGYQICQINMNNGMLKEIQEKGYTLLITKLNTTTNETWVIPVSQVGNVTRIR